MKRVRLRLTLAYDGSQYQGWQAQKIGKGIQELVEIALHTLFPGCGPIHGSSRTDTGVHAMGLVAHVDIPADEWRMSSAQLVLALNAHLPEDVRVTRAARARPSFHARFNAVGKEYRYTVWNAPAANPLLRHRAWHVPRPLDLAAMRQSAAHFIGRHDFASFRTSPGYACSNSIRTITRCVIRRSGPEITVAIEGTGFLYRMCRGIVGTLVQVGQGKIAADAIPQILRERNRTAAGMTAPAHGLVLWKVRYKTARGSAAEEEEKVTGPQEE